MALGREDREAAVAIYRGPFPNGFHLSDAEEFEQWADGERSRWARRYNQAVEQLAEHEARGGNMLRAAEWWGRLAKEDPYNSRIALRYMQGLEVRATGRQPSGTRASIPNSAHGPRCCAGTRGRRLCGETQARVARRLGRDAGPTAFAFRGIRPRSRARRTPARPPVAAPPRPIHRNWVVWAGLVGVMVVGLGVIGGTLAARSAKLVPQRVAAAPLRTARATRPR